MQFHVKSLSNLQAAMHQTQRLCAIMVDTCGQEVLASQKQSLSRPGFQIDTRRLSARQDDEVDLPSKRQKPYCKAAVHRFLLAVISLVMHSHCNGVGVPTKLNKSLTLAFTMAPSHC